MKRFLRLIIAALILYGCWELRADQPQGHVGCTAENFTGNGTIKQGCWSLTLITSSSFTGSINGATLGSSQVIPNIVPAGARTNDISVLVSAGTLTAIEMR